jgi:hypothetical protein
MIERVFYIIGSLCFLTGSLISMASIPRTQPIKNAIQFDTIIQFSRTDGTVWSCTPRTAEHPEIIAYNHAAIGSHTNYFNGSIYTIDPIRNTLLKDGVELGQLIWSATGRPWDVQSHYGFAINQGQGWLATTDSDADNQSFLLKVNLQNATVDYVDSIDGPSLFQINGLIVRTLHYEAPRRTDDF